MIFLLDNLGSYGYWIYKSNKDHNYGYTTGYNIILDRGNQLNDVIWRYEL